MINIPKGTKDVLPEESHEWQYVEGIIREVASIFCLKEIRTPTFEHTELFLRGVGETTDVVNKEMYTFNDKGNRSMTLKPEGTAGVVRSFIENGLFNSAMPLKMYYETPVFRYERPQAGRLREHHQFGVEIYGAKGADTDAEVILIAHTLLKKAGLNVELNVNSIGCPVCRKKYNEALNAYLQANFNDLCPVCQERCQKNTLRVLDCKNDTCKRICEDAPKIIDYLCEECSEHFENLKSYLNAANLPFKVNPKIVRGLDYYTRTVFEFVTCDLGAQGTVCGGGRYDNLVSQLGGANVPCVGFGMGIERILMLMKQKGVFMGTPNKADLYIATIGEKAHFAAFELCHKLRLLGVKCEIDHMERGIKPQFKYADKIGASFVLTIGESELESKKAVVKNMQERSEKECELCAESIYSAIVKG